MTDSDHPSTSRTGESMKLWMSAEIDADVYESYRLVRRQVEDAVNALLAASDYGGGVQEWAFIPMITTSQAPDYREVAQFSKKDRSVEFRLRIPHGEFSRASREEQRALVLESLIRSVLMMPQLGIEGLDARRLTSDLERLAADHNWPAQP